MVHFHENLILLDLEASSREEAIQALAALLVREGYAEPTYAAAVLRREEEYPTGLPTDDVATALPHAFDGGMLKTGVAAARLKSPVTFRCMGSPDTLLEVSLVFLLCNAGDSDGHLAELQGLMNCFCREGLLLDLMKTKSPAEFRQVFENESAYALA